MEIMRHRNRQVWLTAGLFILFAMGVFMPSAAKTAWDIYSMVSIRRHYYQWQSKETRFFHLRFMPADAGLAARIGGEADAAVLRIAEILPHDTGGPKPWLVLAPDQKTLQEAFDWGEETRALGVYISSTIKILSPRAWEWVVKEEQLSLFARQGPLVHEYTHYVLDLRTNGNYTRWFSEGMAQLLEYHILGYEWVEAGSSLKKQQFTLEQLDQSFDTLGNDALVYRQSLSMVTYMESLRGTAGLNVFLDQLHRGTPFYRALALVYGLDRAEFMRQWHSWHSSEDRWFKTG